MRHRGWLSLVCLLLGTSVLAAAGPATTTQKRGGTLRLSSPRGPDSLDPAVAYQTGSWGIEFVTCAKLYNYPDEPAGEGAVVVPEVANGFPKVSSDGKTQTIALKRTYRFHTGQRVTAANYAAALNRDANPKLQSPAITYLHEIVGADAVFTGDRQTIAGVRVLGPYTLQIRATTPVTDLVSRLTMPFFCPVAVDTPAKEIGSPLGSGPYYVASNVLDRKVVLERNRFYRGPRQPNVDRVDWSIGLGPEACRDAVERNQIDLCSAIPPADYAEIAAKYGINRPNGQFFFSPTLATSYFAFNHDRPAFKGPGQIPLAKAINWAIDRHALVQAAGYLGGKRTDQILPPAMGRTASIYPINGVTDAALARARSLLAKAKLKPKTLVLWAPSFPPPAAWAQIFQYDLKRLGIDVQIEYFQSFGVMIPKAGIRGAAYDVILNGWFADYADPISFFSSLDGRTLKPTGNANDAYFDNPKYNRAIARIGRLTGKARARAWANLDVEMMRNDPPWAPFMTNAARDFVSPSFGCYVYHPVYGVDLGAACKK
jgi:ABC-type oligopeptide transport system substrate-binding subunit